MTYVLNKSWRTASLVSSGITSREWSICQRGQQSLKEVMVCFSEAWSHQLDSVWMKLEDNKNTDNVLKHLYAAELHECTIVIVNSQRTI